MKKLIKYVVFALIVIMSVVLVWFLAPYTKKPHNKYFYVYKSDSFNEVVNNMIKNHNITSTKKFTTVATFLGYPDQIKEGMYEIKPGTSVYKLVKTLQQGKQTPVNFVINKIRTEQDFAQRVAQYFEMDSAYAYRYLTNNDSLKQFGVDTNTVFTHILQNTYQYYWNAYFTTIYKKLNKASELYWNTDNRIAKAEAHGLTPTQAYILASIIDEETNLNSEKPLIASVYINRLKKGMKLQADPTVKYALNDFTLKRIYQKHTAVASPFNTYHVTGLPPAPICIPATASIEAVLNAPPTNYLYFVAQPNLSGKSNYSETYEQHQKYAVVYQKFIDSFLTARRNK